MRPIKRARGILVLPRRQQYSMLRRAVPRRMYHSRLVQHYESPQNVGSMDRADPQVGTGLVGSPACGDVVKLQIKVVDGIIVDTKFKTFGCGAAVASSSYTTERIRGQTVEAALSVTNRDIADYLNLPPVKLHCSMLAEEAVKAAVADWHSTSCKAAPP